MVPRMAGVGAGGPLDGKSRSLRSLGWLREKLVFPRMVEVGTCGP